MRFFLAKTDPETYSIDDLARDGVTVWDGVHNYTAIAVIKSWSIGDRVLIYHSQGERTIAGLAEVVGVPYADPHDARGISWVAKIKYLRTYSEPRVTLSDVKSHHQFADFALVRQGRLSTMECPREFVTWLRTRGLDLS